MDGTNYNKYTAITIGPIVEVLLQARKTRELWAGSYLFSYIMKKIADKIGANNILLPAIQKENKQNGAGLYPDRIICTLNDLKVNKHIDQVKLELAEKIYKSIEVINYKKDGKWEKLKEPFHFDQVLEYLNCYLKIYTIEVEAEKSKIIETLYPYLETRELQNRIIQKEEIVVNDPQCPFHNWNPLQLFLYHINGSFLFEDGFGKEKERFESLLEIATRDFKQIDKKKKYTDIIESNLEDKKRQFRNINEGDDFDDDLSFKLKNTFKDHYKARHKYIAIIHADGDNIGQIIKRLLENEANLKNFSETMLAFASEATDMIIDYGGAPIYMGGDDMLFFAPVAKTKYEEKDGKYHESEITTVFNLVQQLDGLFQTNFKHYIDRINSLNDENVNNPEWKNIPLPSMSFGISITYYKYPLYEARNLSYSLLEDVKLNVNGKNSVKAQLQKHSGKLNPFILRKNRSSFHTMLSLLKKGIRNPNFLNSINLRINNNKAILRFIANDKERLIEFFKYNNKREYSLQNDFYEILIRLITELSDGSGNAEKLKEDDFELLDGILRFIHFINSEDKE